MVIVWQKPAQGPTEDDKLAHNWDKRVAPFENRVLDAGSIPAESTSLTSPLWSGDSDPPGKLYRTRSPARKWVTLRKDGE